MSTSLHELNHCIIATSSRSWEVVQMSGRSERVLEARVASLERQVEFLLRINGLDLSGLRDLDDEKLLSLYQDAAHLLAIPPKGFDMEVVERWAEIFLQLSEYEYTRLQSIVDYDHTWEPFYVLCTKLCTRVRTSKLVSTDYQVQQLYAVLNKGLKNIRDVAVVMVRKYPKGISGRTKVLLRGDDLSTII